MTYRIDSNSLDDTLRLGAKLGANLRGGECLELTSDLGGGKTALVRGLAAGAGSKDQVASPTFTISRVYRTDRLEIHHYDFYRIGDNPGLITQQLAESLNDSAVVTVIEWPDTVSDVLPAERFRINIETTGENSRIFTFYTTRKHQYLLAGIIEA